MLQVGTICSFLYGFYVSPARQKIQSAAAYGLICTILTGLRLTQNGQFYKIISTKLIQRIQNILNIKTGLRDNYYLPTIQLSAEELKTLLKNLTKDRDLLTHWIQVLPKSILLETLNADQEFWLLRVCLLMSELLQKKGCCGIQFFKEFRPHVIMFFSLLKVEILGWICGSAGYGFSMFCDSPAT